MKRTPAQLPGSDGQAPALILVETPTLASNLLAQDTVLFRKIVDGILRPPV